MDRRNLTLIVKNILLEHPATRNSDDVLYVKVLEVVAPEALAEPADKFFLHRAGDEVPSIECVSRLRRKVQEEEEETRSERYTEMLRKRQEKSWKEWARGNAN